MAQGETSIPNVCTDRGDRVTRALIQTRDLMLVRGECSMFLGSQGPLISLGDNLDKTNHSYQSLRVAAVDPGALVGRQGL